MVMHRAGSDLTDFFTHKLQAANLLATLEALREGVYSAEDDAYLAQGVELFETLGEGRRLYSESKVTRDLVSAGSAFMAAAASLGYTERDKLDICQVEVRKFCDIVKQAGITHRIPEDRYASLRDFLLAFAKAMQRQIDARREQAHIPSFF